MIQRSFMGYSRKASPSPSSFTHFAYLDSHPFPLPPPPSSLPPHTPVSFWTHDSNKSINLSIADLPAGGKTTTSSTSAPSSASSVSG